MNFSKFGVCTIRSHNIIATHYDLEMKMLKIQKDINTLSNLIYKRWDISGWRKSKSYSTPEPVIFIKTEPTFTFNSTNTITTVRKITKNTTRRLDIFFVVITLAMIRRIHRSTTLPSVVHGILAKVLQTHPDYINTSNLSDSTWTK